MFKLLYFQKQNQQKIIYSGKLLQDDVVLKDILHQFASDEDNCVHTVHLVCSLSAEENMTTTVPAVSIIPLSRGLHICARSMQCLQKSPNKSTY